MQTSSYAQGSSAQSKPKLDFALIRINNDIKEYFKEKSPTENCITTIWPLQEDQSRGAVGFIRIEIQVGDARSLFYGQSLLFELHFPPKYPHSSPKMFMVSEGQPSFVNRVTREVSLPLLSPQNWSAVLSLQAVVIALELLLLTPLISSKKRKFSEISPDSTEEEYSQNPVKRLKRQLIELTVGSPTLQQSSELSMDVD